MTAISFQMYCFRNFDFNETIEMLGKIGVDAVEGYGPLFEDAAATNALLKANGMSMPTGHFALDFIEKDPEGVIAVAKEFGMEAVLVPFLMPADRPTDGAGWAAFGKRLADAGKPIMDAGFKFGWHNHDFEFIPTDDGAMPIEEIMKGSEDLVLELDLAWVSVAGQDPVAWINRYADRLVSVHVKDRAPDGENADEDGWADVGHGTMDWNAIVGALKAAGVNRYVIEHDNPNDADRFASRSFETVKSF